MKIQNNSDSKGSSFIVRVTIVNCKVFRKPVTKKNRPCKYIHIIIYYIYLRFQTLLAQTCFMSPPWTNIPETSLIQGRYPTAMYLDDNNEYKLYQKNWLGITNIRCIYIFIYIPIKLMTSVIIYIYIY